MDRNANFSAQIKRSLFWKILEKVSVQGINLLVQILLARILLPKDFGNLAIIVAVTNYGAIFVQSGVSTVIIQQKEVDKKDISTLLVSSLFFALILYIVLFISSPLISDIYGTQELTWPLRTLSLILFLNSINAIQTGIYSRNMEFKKIFLRSIIAVPVSGIIGIILAIYGFGLWALVTHNLLNMGITVLVMAFDKKTWVGFSFSIDSFKRLYAFTIKIIITGVITGGSDLLRTLVIGKKYSKEELAYYDKAYTYSNYATLIVGQAVTSVMLPSFSKVQDDGKTLKKMASTSIGLSAFLMFPILMGIAAVADPLINILLTSKWAFAAPYLTIFCILRMPSFVSSIDKQVYFALGKSEINMFYEIAFLILNITTLLLCMQFGVLWIALGSTIIEWIGCITLFFVSSKVYGYSLKQRILDLWKPLLNSTIMFIVVRFIELLQLNSILKLGIQIIVGIIIYISLAVLTRDGNLNIMFKLLKGANH